MYPVSSRELSELEEGEHDRLSWPFVSVEPSGKNGALVAVLEDILIGVKIMIFRYLA